MMPLYRSVNRKRGVEKKTQVACVSILVGVIFHSRFQRDVHVYLATNLQSNCGKA